MNRPIPESGSLFVHYANQQASLKVTREFLSSGLVALKDSSKTDLSNGSAWRSDVSRADGREAHSWFFARPWYSAESELTEDEKTTLSQKIEQAIDTWTEHAEDEASMAFHDETTAQRAMVFTALLFAFQKSFSRETKTKLLTVLNRDIDLLESDSFYAGLNNHGMFQDVALLVAVDYGYASKKAKLLEDKAFGRLEQYFSKSFTADGIHTENNPTYHVMVARYLSRVIAFAETRGRSGQFKDLKNLMGKADLYAAFAVTPFGDFPPISDTNLQRLNALSARATFDEGYLLGVLTNGKEGTIPTSRVYVAEDSGYGIARSGWTSTEDTYLFFNAAYNADYHKHSDELSVYFSSRGFELLTEAGPNGYQYNDPFTKYAFSSFAHNTLVVDGEGLPRTDGNAHLTELTDQGSSFSKLNVTGRTQRFDGVDWTRSVTLDVDSPEEGDLQISDAISSDQRHTYKFCWHIGSEIIPYVRGSFIEFYSKNTQEKIAEMEWTGETASTIHVVNGQRHPRVQGWQFPLMGEKTPTYSVEIEFEGRSISVEWTLRVNDFVLRNHGMNPFNPEWKTFYGEKPVHYLLEMPDNNQNPESLAIVFSGVNSVGDFPLNYRESFASFKGAVLYVLDDFGRQGTYYLSSSRNLAEFRAVQGLLKSVISELGITTDEVTTFGYSKGGTSALLHGVTLGVSDVFAGAPQYLIGNFLKKSYSEVLQYISGGVSKGDIHWANKIALNILSSAVRSTQIHVVVGLADSHYREHAIPLIDDARSLGYQAKLLTIPGATHSEFRTCFREIIRTWIEADVSEEEFLVPYTVGFDSGKKLFGVCLALPIGARARGQLFYGSERVGSVRAFTGSSASWEISEPGPYRIRIYVDLPNGAERKAFGTSRRQLRW